LKELEQRDDVLIKRQVPMSGLTTFRIGGPARIVVAPRTVEAIEKCLERLNKTGRRFHVLGRGSNVLVSDHGVDTVLSLQSFSGFRVSAASVAVGSSEKIFTVTAGAGSGLRQLVAWCASRGIGGLEGLAGIPASIGGALCMNAGAGGVSFGDFVQEILLTSPRGSYWAGAGEMRFGYRKTRIPENCVVSAVRLRLRAVPPHTMRQNIASVMKMRAASQPLGKASAGCIFRNFNDAPAGLLIDKCGLKGLRRGGAMVSAVHANFIVNTGGASCSDVQELIEDIRMRVSVETGRTLHPEIRIWH